MNQILATKINKHKNLLKRFKVQFYISIIAIIIFLFLYIFYLINLERERTRSDIILQNYKVFKLYSTSNKSKIYKDDDIIGTIIIPSININYPFFYGISDELLKISPCRFNGKMPQQKSNLCIAGHNYNDNRFFSQLATLKINDLIIIEDNNKNQFYYYIYDIYEVAENDIQSAINYEGNNFEITLLTCNNVNDNRIIVKAKLEAKNLASSN